MKRRDFIAGLGGAAVVGPRGACAQSPMPLIGFVGGASLSVLPDQLSAFRDGLKLSGYIEGLNVTVEPSTLLARADEGHREAASCTAVHTTSRRRINPLVLMRPGWSTPISMS